MASQNPLNPETAASVVAEVLATPALPAGPHLADEDYVAYEGGFLPAEDLARVDEHLSSCLSCTEKMLTFYETMAEWSGVQGEQRLEAVRGRLLAHEPSARSSPAVVLAARFAWDTVQNALRITFDQVRALVAPDSPFGAGFQLAQAPPKVLGLTREKPLASASNTEGEQLRIVVDGRTGQIKARFYGEAPPPMSFAPSGGDTGPERELVWEAVGAGWEANLGDPTACNGILIVRQESRDQRSG